MLQLMRREEDSMPDGVIIVRSGIIDRIKGNKNRLVIFRMPASNTKNEYVLPLLKKVFGQLIQTAIIL